MVSYVEHAELIATSYLVPVWGAIGVTNPRMHSKHAAVMCPPCCCAKIKLLCERACGQACATRQPVCSCAQYGLLCGTKEAISRKVWRASFRLNSEPRTCGMGQIANELYCHEAVPVL